MSDSTPRYRKTSETFIELPSWPRGLSIMGMDILDNGQGENHIRVGHIKCRYGLPRIIVTDNRRAQLFSRKGKPEALWKESKPRLGREKADGTKEAAAIREARYKSKMEQYYNKKVRAAGLGRILCIEGMRQARVEEPRESGSHGGPYRDTEAFENGSYKLQTMEDKIVPRTWHAINLRKCYL
ncbi:hypothetical protein Tco_1041566 [Tanacetum coccineum]|uniref:Integrase catalytic domain-containing protein n=1 Tax=Tanacetum coccineum TaxID=301880 RepID=A0ABQ5GH49_9ASTR